MDVDAPNFDDETFGRFTEHVAKAIAGTSPDEYGIGQRYWSAFAHSLFTSIIDSFDLKSSHQADELGETWDDLTPETVAYNRKDARIGFPLYDNRAKRHPNLRVRPTLPPSVNAQWAGMWYGIYQYYSFNKYAGPHKADKRVAGAYTWEHFKAAGYPTLIGAIGHRKLAINVRSGLLRDSLTPAPMNGGIYVPLDRNQICVWDNGKLTIGTKVPYADQVAKRRSWLPKNLGPWKSRANKAGKEAVLLYLPEVVHRFR